MKIANIDRQILHIFWTTWGILTKFSGKMSLKIVLNVTKKQGFTFFHPPPSPPPSTTTLKHCSWRRISESGIRIYLWCQLLVKKFIERIYRLLNLWWANNMPRKNIALKAIMPALQLQKASKILKAKDHLKALERRPRSREEGNITKLMNKSKTIQERLPSTSSKMNIKKPLHKFKQLMQKR